MSKIISIIVIIIVIAGGAWILTSNSDSNVIPAPAENIKTESSPSMDTTSTEAPQSNVATQPTTPDITNTQIETPIAPIQTQLPATSTETSTPTVNVKEFTVDGKNFSFAPSALTVKKGDTVRIVFKNVGGFHDLKIDEFNVATKQIGDGQTDTIEFVADKTGSFEYYCSVGSHRAMGMKGALIVQ